MGKQCDREIWSLVFSPNVPECAVMKSREMSQKGREEGTVSEGMSKRLEVLTGPRHSACSSYGMRLTLNR